ncbi:MAG: bifunctional nuclease family protein [bacterium]|nr:bifunctional nuclease family protein [bacterium]
MNFLEARIDGLALDMTTNSPVVVLAALETDRVLPIWIGHAEAWGIAMQLSGVEAQRPMTYDLIKSVIHSLEAVVNRVEITELREQTFYAQLHLEANGRKYQVDSRPSDSIAIALKTGAKIFVNEVLFNLQTSSSDATPDIPNDPESLRERLKKINPEDFGKYSL